MKHAVLAAGAAFVLCACAPVQWSVPTVRDTESYMPSLNDMRPTVVYLAGPQGSVINMPQPATHLQVTSDGVAHLTK